MEILFFNNLPEKQVSRRHEVVLPLLKVKIRKTKNDCLVNTPAVVMFRNEKETTNRGGDGETQAHTEPGAPEGVQA